MRANLVITKLDAGGMERVCVTLCNQFAREGRACALVALYPAGASRGWLAPEVGYREILRPARRAAGAFIRIARQDPGAPFLAFGIEIYVVLALLKRLGLIRNPVYYRESTSLQHYYSRFWRGCMRLTLPWGDGAILQSESGREDYSRLRIHAPRFAVLANPCALAEGQRAGEAFRLPAADGAFRLLSVGRLARIKGHRRLVEAFARLLRVRPGSELTLVGEGEEREALLQSVRAGGLGHAVRLVPRTDDVASAYRSADLLVLPSFFEGQSNVLIEALACGCPVLAFGGGGSREFLSRLGLGAFWCDDASFEESLLAGVERVGASDPRVWSAARNRLLDEVQPGRVADQVWRFIGGD
jgi:glycosyltransferase involved in cell wall biosynthesis